ncbi:uncharacterized protein LOC108088211 isoform X2 [Drosophila ficusphila]|uniref:uncharacterized protein LOC108088211 isoform X2 n=1 Tax=Drosophila ficusphila TaxID=30025 RepID=UPI001C8A7FC7|nr:uncharacterized protein LOC108088211 isoform X2 [Drosophila ficusphila]
MASETAVPKKPVKMDESKDMRYSLEIDEDLKRPLKARTQTVPLPNPIIQKNVNFNEETIYEGSSLGQLDDGDDSFSAFERMCDKTGSDPDSTLFQYLHSEDRSQVMARAKDRSTDDQKEIDALRRMLEAVGTDEDLLENESPVKGVECTQLEDVEAPSRFWDNTLAGVDESACGSGLEFKTKVSPVKMVGLLRPSTIIEDNEQDSDVSSHVSFRSARTLKTNASSCYETATDSSLSGTLLNVDDLFYAAIAKAKPPGMSKGEELELLNDLHGSLQELASLPKEEEEEPLDDVEDTIIELSSSDDEEVQLVSEVKQEDTSRVSAFGINKSTDQTTVDENKENSLHFNDTMEEMQYMMQKGMEFMTGGAPPTAAVKPLSPVLAKQNTFLISPKQMPKAPAAAFVQPSLPLRSCNKPQSVGASPSKAKQPPKVELSMEWNRKKFFSGSSGIPQRRQQQIKQPPYANIVSPIRTYTQKSGIAPLMSTFRPISTDMLTTLAISELEQESRLCQLKPVSNSQASTSKGIGGFGIKGIDSTAHLLPKKAYISSEIKHMVDERTPVPMPSVPRIQKYLNSAVEPTVLRHDGKMKMPGETTRNPSSTHIPRRANHSLADLSLASGDVSLYTIRDAQKF